MSTHLADLSLRLTKLNPSTREVNTRGQVHFNHKWLFHQDGVCANESRIVEEQIKKKTVNSKLKMSK